MKYCTKGGKCCLADKTLSNGEEYCCIYWIVIYSVDGGIQPQNYLGLGFFFGGGGGQGFSRLVGRGEGKGIHVYCI